MTIYVLVPREEVEDSESYFLKESEHEIRGIGGADEEVCTIHALDFLPAGEWPRLPRLDDGNPTTEGMENTAPPLFLKEPLLVALEDGRVHLLNPAGTPSPSNAAAPVLRGIRVCSRNLAPVLPPDDSAPFGSRPGGGRLEKSRHATRPI